MGIKGINDVGMAGLVEEIESDWNKQLLSALAENKVEHDKKMKQYFFITQEGARVGVSLIKLKNAYSQFQTILDSKLEELQKETLTTKQEKIIASCIYIIERLQTNLINANYQKECQECLEKLKALIQERHLEIQMEMAMFKGNYQYTTAIELKRSKCISPEAFKVYTNREFTQKTITPKDVIHLVDKGNLSKEEACEIVGAETYITLYQEKKNVKYLKMLPEDILLRMYLIGKVKQEELSKTNIGRKTIIELLEQEKISKNELKQLIKKGIPKKMQPRSEELYQLYEEQKITGKDVLDLVKLDAIEDSNLIGVYEWQKKMGSTILFPEVFENEFITDKEMLDYFSVDKILQKKEEGKLSEEFWKMYHEISETEPEEAKSRKNQLIEKLKEKDDLESYIYFLENSELEVSDIKDKIDEEAIINLKESNKIQNETIFLLYQERTISSVALSLMFEGEEDQIVKACNEGLLDESALELLSKEEQKEEFKRGNLSAKNVFQLYNLGMIEIQDLKELNIPSNELVECIGEEYPIERIEELFLNRILDYDSFASLLDREILTQEEFVAINRKFNFKEAIQELRDRQVKNNAVPQGDLRNNGKKYTRFLEEGHREQPRISVETREAFFKSIHCEDLVPVYRGDGLELNQKAALEGYDYAINEELGVIILEKSYEDNITRNVPALSNATYILPPVKLIEYLEKRNKQDLRLDPNVEWVNHSKNWGQNVLGACAKVGKMYTKKELVKKYQEEIQLIQEEYTQNKGEENGKR